MRKDIQKLDKQNMEKVLLNMSSHITYIPELKGAKLFTLPKSIENIVVSGMGGSAIGADVISNLLLQQGISRIPIVINRSYDLPSFVGKNTLVIISSYSGETEETISAYKKALKQKAKVVCISSGGKILQMAIKNGNPLALMPSRIQPRCAIIYFISVFFYVLEELGFIPNSINREKLSLFIKKHEGLIIKSAKDIAKSIGNNMVIVYTSNEKLAALAKLWKILICENAKTLAFHNLVPEMNHNEIVGWTCKTPLHKKMTVVYLQDDKMSRQNKKRIDITKKMLEHKVAKSIKVIPEGKSSLDKILYLTVLGSWTSFYLAILKKIDPSPITAINSLKTLLKKTR